MSSDREGVGKTVGAVRSSNQFKVWNVTRNATGIPTVSGNQNDLDSDGARSNGADSICGVRKLTRTTVVIVKKRRRKTA